MPRRAPSAISGERANASAEHVRCLRIRRPLSSFALPGLAVGLTRKRVALRNKSPCRDSPRDWVPRPMPLQRETSVQLGLSLRKTNTWAGSCAPVEIRSRAGTAAPPISIRPCPRPRSQVELPDGAELELENGATGADAAAAIGPGLAKAALAIKADGELRDLSAPLSGGERIEIVTDKSPEALDLVRHDAAHVLAEAVLDLWPAAKISIGPPIADGLLLRHRLPGRRAPRPGGPRPDRGADARAHRRRRALRAARAARGRGDRALPGRGPGLQGRADRGPGPRRGRRDRDAVPQRPLRGPLPRPARPLDRAHRRLQADLARRRLLARRRDPPDADPHLRHRFSRSEAARRAPRAARAGARAGPPQAGPRAGPVHAAAGGARDALLAPERQRPAAS